MIMKDFTLDDINRLIWDQNTYNPTGDAFLDSRYDEHIAQNGKHLYYRLFYHLVKLLEPSLVVELGSWQGTAAAHFASGQGGRTTVVTIDHHTDPGDEENKVKMLEAEAKYDNLYYIQGWTNDILAEREKDRHALGNASSALPELGHFLVSDMIRRVGGYRKKSGIGILFIDSWHKHLEALMDWQAYSPLLSSSSLVICDDIINLEMLRFWDELPGEKFLEAAAHPGYPMGFLKYG